MSHFGPCAKNGKWAIFAIFVVRAWNMEHITILMWYAFLRNEWFGKNFFHGGKNFFSQFKVFTKKIKYKVKFPKFTTLTREIGIFFFSVGKKFQIDSNYKRNSTKKWNFPNLPPCTWFENRNCFFHVDFFLTPPFYRKKSGRYLVKNGYWSSNIVAGMKWKVYLCSKKIWKKYFFCNFSPQYINLWKCGLFHLWAQK